jgi:hypothetical protein
MTSTSLLMSSSPPSPSRLPSPPPSVGWRDHADSDAIAEEIKAIWEHDEAYRGYLRAHSTDACAYELVPARAGEWRALPRDSQCKVAMTSVCVRSVVPHSGNIATTQVCPLTFTSLCAYLGIGASSLAEKSSSSSSPSSSAALEPCAQPPAQTAWCTVSRDVADTHALTRTLSRLTLHSPSTLGGTNTAAAAAATASSSRTHAFIVGPHPRIQWSNAAQTLVHVALHFNVIHVYDEVA